MICGIEYKAFDEKFSRVPEVLRQKRLNDSTTLLPDLPR